MDDTIWLTRATFDGCGAIRLRPKTGLE